MIDTHDIREMVKMARYISYIKYVVIINMALFISIITIYYYEIRQLKNEINKAEKEVRSLKADIHDSSMKRSKIVDE